MKALWAALAYNAPSFAEYVGAWSTAAVALFALGALVVPWLERRRQRKLVDRRVAAMAPVLLAKLIPLAVELAERARKQDATLEWARQYLPRIEEFRDRVSDLASVAVAGSAAVARAVTRVLIAVTDAAGNVELCTSAVDVWGKSSSYATAELQKRMTPRFHILIDCVSDLHAISDREARKTYDVLRERYEMQWNEYVRRQEGEGLH